jgi:GT2 family glycosyltransferase
VQLIALGRNVGLSEGYNAGLRWALARGYDYALLLNNDVILSCDTLRLLVDAAECYPDVGLVSPKIYLGQPPSDRIYWAGGWLTLRPWAAPTRGYRQHERGRFEDMCEADLAANTAVLVRCQMVRQVGLLDPVYFYMCEDFDWSLRARQHGYRVLYLPQARVWHLESSTIGFLSRRMVYYYARNMQLLMERYYPDWHTMRAMLTVQLLLFMVMFIVTARPGAIRVPLWAWSDYRHRRFGEASSRFRSNVSGST